MASNHLTLQIYGKDACGALGPFALTVPTVDAAWHAFHKRREIGWHIDAAEVVDASGAVVASHDGQEWRKP
jgi:hypothetical protein